MEPHLDTRDMYVEYLRRNGFMVVTADTTDEGDGRAVDADVIVTEIRVPGTYDGLDFVRRTRDRAGSRKVAIIVLTSNEGEEATRLAHAAGSDLCLIKPCLPDSLAQAIRAIINGTGVDSDLINPAGLSHSRFISRARYS